MKLSDTDIMKYISAGKIAIEPAPNRDWINGASVDLTLGPTFRVFSSHACSHFDLGMSRAEIDSAIARATDREITLSEGDVFYLHPGELALGATHQSIQLSADVCATINGRSSLARLGLMVHSTAHFVDPGWSGRIVLEFFNCGRHPLGLRAGLAVCAVAFEPLSSPAQRCYASRDNAKYHGQEGTVVSRIGRECV